MPSIGVAEFYAGKSIFITGATGFLGKVLVEKLLRCCPDLNTIYILVRRKKGQSPESRLETFTSSRLFEKLLEQNPQIFNKLKLISGDVGEEGLGLSIKDTEELERECQIVFNNAASVRFDMPIKQAVNCNTLGIQRLLQFAERMKKLEAFIHVSTAFCHDDVEVLEEKMYPAKHDPLQVIDMLKWMDDDSLAACQAELIKPHPNTYSYAKSLAEHVVMQYAGKFPIVIGRPSIVLPTLNDPMPGWVDNINGPTGAIYAAFRGILHTMYCKDTTKVDTIPVDKAINALILLGYHTALEKSKDIRVCNINNFEFVITWIEASKYCMKYMKEYPLSTCLWYPSATGKNYKILHDIHAFFSHLIPAYFIDLILFLLGKKTFMINIINRLTHGIDLLQYYFTRDWIFKTDYFQSLDKNLSDQEKELFSVNLSNFDVEEFMKNYVKGIREYYCKEDPSTLPKAKKLHKRLYYLHVALMTTVYIICAYLAYRIYEIVMSFV